MQTHRKTGVKKKSSEHSCHLNVPIGNFWRNPKPEMKQQIPGYLDIHGKSSHYQMRSSSKNPDRYSKMYLTRATQSNNWKCCPNTAAEQSAPAVPDQISCQALTHRGWNSAGKQFEEANRELS